MMVYGAVLWGILGALTGSFLNVCIYRLPRKESIVFPGSHCPACQHPIRFYDNIPVLSYLILKGKCRFCKQAISPRYPLVEILNTAFYLLLYYRFGWSWDTVIYSLFASSLLIISFIDLDHRIIPDEISLPGIIAGIAASFLLKGVSPLSSLSGVFLGGGILFLVAFGYEKLAHKEGMGGGDIKLIAMIGAFIGWQGIPFVVLVSSLIGAIIGISLMVIEKKDTKFAIPFGPFLSLGAMIYLFIGPELIVWYLSLGRGGG